MKVRVLGCHGAELPGYKTSGFLINKDTLMDSGTVTSVLTLAEQAEIKNVLISHAHLDHIKDLLFLADNLIGRNDGQTINIISIPEVLDALRTHVLNATIWPDFTSIHSDRGPVLKYTEIKEEKDYSIDDLNIKAVRVNHTVDAVGYIINDDQGAFLYTGDTGSTDKIWEVAGKIENLKGVIAEVSLPDSMGETATRLGHLTPNTLAGELKKLNKNKLRVYAFHIKPQYIHEIKKDLSKMKDPTIKVLDIGDILSL
ncbi:MAG: MBL fold metallo-hydrolase [Thermodesulfobacteriota bacterium]